MDVVLGFVVGVAVGAMLGLLLAPTAHFLVGRSEWKRASRELELADRLLESLSEPLGPNLSREESSSTDPPQRVAHGHRR